MQKLQKPPNMLNSGPNWEFGAYEGELPSANQLAQQVFNQQNSKKILSLLKNKVRHKKWLWVGIFGPRIFSGFSIASLGYVGQAFGYASDPTQRNLKAEKPFLEIADTQWISPIDLGIQVSGSLSRFRAMAINLKSQIRFKTRNGILYIQANLDEIKANLQIGPIQTPLSVLSKMNPAGITMKSFSSAIKGTLELRGVPISLSNTYVAIDWTSAFFPYETLWNWACGIGKDTKGNIVSFNFCKGIHADIAGTYSENGVWVNGRPAALPQVQFQVGYGMDSPWFISSKDGSVQLEFHPLGERQANQDFGIISSRFRQPFGYFTGKITDTLGRSTEFKKIAGVTEDHHARW